MKSDIAASKCDKSGKPIGVNALSAAGATQPSPKASYAPSMASTVPLQQMVPVYSPCPDGSQTSQPTENQHDRTGPEDSHGCKLGRSRIRVVGFWLRLHVLPYQSCRRSPNVAATCRPAKLETLAPEKWWRDDGTSHELRWRDMVQPKTAGHASDRVSNTQSDAGHDLSFCAQERRAQSRPEPKRGSQLHQIQHGSTDKRSRH